MKEETEEQKLATEFCNLDSPHEDLDKLTFIVDEARDLFTNYVVWHRHFAELVTIIWHNQDWKEDELDFFQDWLCQPFLEQYSVSANVRFLLSKENTSDLFRTLEINEKPRPILADPLRRIREKK